MVRLGWVELDDIEFDCIGLGWVGWIGSDWIAKIKCIEGIPLNRTEPNWFGTRLDRKREIQI